MTRFAVPVAVFLVAALPFARTVRYGIVNCDDYDYVQHAAEPGGLWDVREAIWMPLTWLSYKADLAVAGWLDGGGERPGGAPAEVACRRRAAAHRLMHAHSVLVHAVNAVLLWCLLRLALARGFGGGRSVLELDLVAGAAALFWAVHPLRCESVCWIASRKDVLSMMWLLLALIAWARRRWTAAVGCFVLSAMCKPSAMVFAPLAFVLDWTLLREVDPIGDVRAVRAAADPVRAAWRAGRRYLRYLLPAAMSAGLAVFAGWAQAQGGAMFLFGGLPVKARLLNAAAAFGIYVKNTAWPLDLAPLPLYRWPEMPRFWWQGILVCAATGGLVLWRLRARRGGAGDWLLAGLLWYSAAVVPFLGLKAFGVEPFADRFSYIPAVGFSLMLAGALCAARGRWRAPAGVVLVLALGLCAGRQSGFWRDDGALFRRCLAVEGDGHYDAWANLGLWHFEFGHDLERARECFARALALNPARAGRVYPTYFLTLYELGDREGMRKAHQDFASWDNTMLVKRRLKARGIGSTVGYLMAHALYLASDPGLHDEGVREIERLASQFPASRDVSYARHLLGLLPAEAVVAAPDKNYVNYRFLCERGAAVTEPCNKSERN